MAPIVTSLASIVKQFGIGAVTATAIPTGLTASGGVISDYSDGPAVYRAHIFTSSGTFSVTARGTFGDTVEYLVVAGGGAGSDGGGGAGGLRTNLSGHPLAGAAFPVSTSPGSYTVTVGSGGAAVNNVTRGSDGSPSIFGSITSAGGGAGGPFSNSGTPFRVGNSGGSGGGSGTADSGGVSTAGAGNTPPVSPSQGNPGGTDVPNSTVHAAGGGGGAGGAGSNGSGPPYQGGAGGIGSQVLISGPPASTQSVGTPGPNPGGGYFAGGGGGGASLSSAGGSGGGGAGGATPQPGTPATYSTGGGGGGAGDSSVKPSGSGGSGIVVVRYQIGSLTATAKATGGSISYYNGKTIHTFTSSDVFATTPSWTATNIEYVIIAGGGGGGTDGGYAGGGGSGGYRTGTIPIGSHPVSTTIQIGGGGAKGLTDSNGSNGTPSYFGTPITSTGGGGGGSRSAVGNPGGSGGGGGFGTATAGTGNTPPVSPPQGNPGGANSAGAQPPGASPPYASGGGGGSGGAGQASILSPPTGGYGGVGTQIPTTFRNPASPIGAPGPGGGGFWFAGGGGGGAATGGSGGGPGGPYAGASPGGSGVDATSNTGSGGGGQGGGPGSSAGGSGIVLIAYPS